MHKKARCASFSRQIGLRTWFLSDVMEANKTVLQMKYARIVNLFAKESGMTLEDTLSFFYNSTTYELISEGIADLHCRSDEYLADELMLEYKEKENSK